jgi:tetrahydromethanopterin S-methyltransferase subunit G
MSEESTQNLPQDGVSQILARLDSIDSRLGNVEGRLSALEDKVDRRLQETRPIWEQVLVRLDGVEGQLVSFGGRMDGFERRLDGFESRLDGFEKRLDDFGLELRSSLRRFERQVGKLAKDVLEVRADQADLEDRMDKIESKAR